MNDLNPVLTPADLTDCFDKIQLHKDTCTAGCEVCDRDVHEDSNLSDRDIDEVYGSYGE